MFCFSQRTGCGDAGTEQGVRYSIRKYATSETSRRRKEGAKGFEYSIDCLPKVTQQALRERYALQLMTQKADESPAPVVAKARRSSAVVDAVEAYRGSPQLMVERLNALTENQRQVADARIAIVSEVLKIAQQPGFSCAKAIRFIVDRLSHSQLDERIVAMVEIANARKGNSRALSEITLKRWIAAFNKAQNAAERLLLLAPGKRQEIKAEDINWLPDFLAQYRQSNGRPMTEAYEDFVAEWQHRHADEPYMLDIMPSYDTIRRAMKWWSETKGRVTGSEYRQRGVHAPRLVKMPVNYVWIGDGHGMKLKRNLFTKAAIFGGVLLSTVARAVVGYGTLTRLKKCFRASPEPYNTAFAITATVSVLLGYSGNHRHLDKELVGILPRTGINHRPELPVIHGTGHYRTATAHYRCA
nr:transposase [Escherichia coli]